MIRQPTRAETIARVSPAMVALLEKDGALPALPPEFRVNEALPGFRRPTLSEGSALTWLVSWHGSNFKPTGIVGYQDCYDFHTASDVRAISYLAGGPRAVIELLRFCQREARAVGRRLVGTIDVNNESLARLLSRMGYKKTRFVFEDRDDG